MTEAEWAIVNGLVNYCRNTGLTEATAKHADFSIMVEVDDQGFTLEIDRVDLNGG